MKKIVVFFSIILFAGNIYFAFSQTNPSYIIYDFDYSGSMPPPCYIPDDDDWKTSHGSPYYSQSSQGSYNRLEFVTSFNNGTTKSEGAFISYNFMKTNMYQIEVYVKDITGMPTIDAYAANGLRDNKNMDCEEDVFPKVSDYELIDWAFASCNIFECIELIPKNNYWIPKKDYTQFWITSNPETMQNSKFVVHKIIINDYGFADTVPPTTPDNLRITDLDYNSISVEWDPSTDNTGVAGYEVYCNNTLLGTTTNTQYTISNLTQCTNYQIEVRAFDAYQNYSPKASVDAQTPLQADLVLQTPINLSNQPNKEYIAEASNSITLKPGFSVKANSAQEYFHAKISSGCGKMLFNIPPLDEEDQYLDDISIFPNSKSQSQTEAVEYFTTDYDLRIYPNPASGTITIEYHQFTGMEKMILSDITGKPLMDCKLSGIISSIDISPFSSGVYFIKVITKDNLLVRKIIIGRS